jgi:hypothetical protein
MSRKATNCIQLSAFTVLKYHLSCSKAHCTMLRSPLGGLSWTLQFSCPIFRGPGSVTGLNAWYQSTLVSVIQLKLSYLFKVFYHTFTTWHAPPCNLSRCTQTTNPKLRTRLNLASVTYKRETFLEVNW